jgi:hypothetical protein
MLADNSAQARAGAGFADCAFHLDFDAQRATRPQGKVSASWSPARQRGTDTILVKFDTHTCRPRPMRAPMHHRHPWRPATDHPPPPPPPRPHTGPRPPGHPTVQGHLQATLRGRRHHPPSHRGHRHPPHPLPRTGQDHLEHVYSAVALNLIRVTCRARLLRSVRYR